MERNEQINALTLMVRKSVDAKQRVFARVLAEAARRMKAQRQAAA